MSSPLACLVCNLDPQTSSLILPIAQATIVAAPLILRDEIRKGARAIRERRSSRRGPASRSSDRRGARSPSGARFPKREGER